MGVANISWCIPRGARPSRCRVGNTSVNTARRLRADHMGRAHMAKPTEFGAGLDALKLVKVEQLVADGQNVVHATAGGAHHGRIGLDVPHVVGHCGVIDRAH